MPKIIVGLGNPGPRYARTRHNVGFRVIDRLAAKQGLKVATANFQALLDETRVAGDKVILLKPQTFMNVSGKAVAAAVRFYKVVPDDILVIYDDLDLAPGRLRLRPSGGAGGHKGMQSIIEELGSDAFARLRIGIGRPAPGWDVVDWVLAPFTPDEDPLVEQAVERAVAAVAAFLTVGLAAAMNEFNQG